MKRITTLLAAAAITLAASAQTAGEYVYTASGKYKVLTGENMVKNGDFNDGLSEWTTDGGTALHVDTFAVENSGEDGSMCLIVNAKDNGPGTGSSLYRAIPVSAGQSYIVSYQVKGNDDEVASTVVTGDNVKNYQNIFFNDDASLTAIEGGQIATDQRYGFAWTTFTYSFTAPTEGYVVFHFYAPYIATCFDNFKVMQAQPVPDDREVAAVIARLQAYLDDARFPNGHAVLEDVIGALQGVVEAEDMDAYTEFMQLIDEAIDEFLNQNTGNLSAYVPNLTLDDLKATGANQTSAGAWIIADGLRAVNPSGKTRWAVKAATADTPFTGNYLQNDIPYGSKNKLYEATVHQTVENMPAGEYMFTVKLRGYKLNSKTASTPEVPGLQVFINGDSATCYPIEAEKATSYVVYSTLSEGSRLKLGYYQPDAVANHIDLDFVSLRLIGWTQEQVDEYFAGKEFSEAKAVLKHTIDSARVHYNNAEMLYGKPQLDSAIVASQDYYDHAIATDSLTASDSRLKKEISIYISRNSTLTGLRNAIANAEELVTDDTYGEAERNALRSAIDAAKAYLATLSADNHLTEGYTNADIQAETARLNAAVNVMLASKLEADEKYEFYTWAAAAEAGATFDTDIYTMSEEQAVVTSSGATLYPETALFAGRSLNGRLAFLKEDKLAVKLNAAHGMEVVYGSKNQTTMAILNLKEGDQVTMDWTMGNASHNIMVTSADAKVQLANGSWQEYTKSGKDNANVLPRDNNNGLSGATRSVIRMTQDGTLDFYQSSSNSTIRIYYIGITGAEHVVDGITTVAHEPSLSNQYYDLQGRRIGQPAHGLYIVNGRKVVVR